MSPSLYFSLSLIIFSLFLSLALALSLSLSPPCYTCPDSPSPSPCDPSPPSTVENSNLPGLRPTDSPHSPVYVIPHSQAHRSPGRDARRTPGKHLESNIWSLRLYHTTIKQLLLLLSTILLSTFLVLLWIITHLEFGLYRQRFHKLRLNCESSIAILVIIELLKNCARFR